MKISGLTIVRNALINGYMIAEVIDTLAAVADEVIVCDGHSTDGTFEYLQTRSDIKLFQNDWNLQSNNGLEFAQITNHGLKRCTGDYIFYLQADELIHENQIDALKELILSDKHNSISCKFHHIRYDFDYCLTEGYKRAARVIRNGIGISSFQDGFDFTGDVNPQCNSEMNIYHFGYVFLENILNKMINHSDSFYVDAPNYAQRKKLAQQYLERIAAGESFNALELQQILEPGYALTRHELPLPACMERLRAEKISYYPVHKYTLPKVIDVEPETPIQTVEDLAIHANYWNIDNINFERAHRGAVWVNHELKIAYLGIPKCANSSIRSHLKPKNAILPLGYMQDMPDDYFIFTTIRDPISRLVSAYIETVQKCSAYPRGRYNTDLELSQDKIAFLDDLMKNHDDCGRFSIYLNQLQEWGFFEPHCVPQIIYLTDENNKVYQNIEIFKTNDLTNLEDRLGYKIQKINQSENPDLKQKLLDFIMSNIVIKDQIEKLYEYDLKIWHVWGT